MNKLATRTTGIFAAMTAVLITAFAALVAMPLMHRRKRWKTSGWSAT